MLKYTGDTKNLRVAKFFQAISSRMHLKSALVKAGHMIFRFAAQAPKLHNIYQNSLLHSTFLSKTVHIIHYRANLENLEVETRSLQSSLAPASRSRTLAASAFPPPPSLTMAVEVSLNTPLAEALSNVVQPKLSEVGWSTGGLDDSALGEYIILMLVNGKTQEQIAAELSNDLLNLGPDDSGAIDFSKWLFEQVELLNSQLNGGSAPQGPSAQPGQTVQSHPNDSRLSQGERRQSGGGGALDAVIGEAMDGVQEGNMYAALQKARFLVTALLTSLNRPTGPKSMRNGSRTGNKRLMGQLSKAMDRSSDAVLHRVRPQQGTERINMHNRQPPKGPRNDHSRNQRMPSNGRLMSMSNGPILNGGHSGPPLQMTPQQQMSLIAMYEEQARMMSQIFSPQQQQLFMPGLAQPAINPAFHNSHPQAPQPGRSLFERVESNPQRQNGAMNKRSQQNGGSFHTRNQQNGTSAVDSLQVSTNGDLSSSMEVESSQTNSSEQSPDTICKFNLSCTKKDCPFAHQSPAAPPGTTIDVNDTCPFGAACKNRKCVARHPSPAQKAVHHAEQECKFFPNCTNASCPFRHPTMPMCRNGADCTREGCKFTHVKIMCKFNPCLNPTCPYKHIEGQKRGAFDDKVWVADGGQEKGHVSERKFVDDAMVEEELIVPDNQAHESQPSSLGAEVVT